MQGDNDPVRAENTPGAEPRSKTMKTRRFVKSIVKTAQTTDVAMPWERGARRAALIEKRATKPLTLKSA